MTPRRAASLALLSMSTVACGALLALEPLDFDEGQAREAGATEGSVESGGGDVTVDPVDGGASDGPSVDADAAPPVGFCQGLGGTFDGGPIVFCDDFERASPLEKGWLGITQNGGSLSLSTEASVSGTRSLLVNVPSGASGGVKGALLKTPDLPSGAKIVTVEMDLRIDVAPPATGSYPSNGFVLGRSYNIGGGFEAAFVTVPVAGTFNPGFLPGDPPAPTPFLIPAWHHLVWRIVNGAMTLEVKAKNTGNFVVRTDTQPQDPRYFEIGAEADPSLGPAKMFIDDIVMYR